MNTIEIADAAARLKSARRIMVIGCSGSGKSTLSRQLADRHGLPYISMDREFFWLPGWQVRGKSEMEGLVAEAVKRPSWIMDGTSPRTMQARLARAELVIWTRPPRWTSVRGIVKRRFRYAGRSRPDMAEGCPERLNWDFIRYVWTFEQKFAPRVERMLDLHGGDIPVCVLKSYAENNELLALSARDH
ncbi:AAA family ATPase [uncultured Martelella sp.]|uniref:AAA family ATPase n=1 Tax=uncultured Martelella sp. TaxID=392331 RepID=UPI0029C82418|nr:AAA family ATPase [uncultured Martelella sp.]